MQTTSQLPEKGVNGKAAIIARRRNTHIRHKAIMQKSAQSALRGCRLGTAIGALQGPFDITKTSRSPAFRWSISSVCGITRTDTHMHTRRVWCGVEPKGSENGKTRCVVRGKGRGQQKSSASMKAAMHIAPQSPMADPSSGTVMHLTFHPTEKLRCP